MSALKAIGVVNSALTVMIELSIQMQKINAVLEAAQREDRKITPEEWASLDEDLATAKQRAKDSRP